MMKTFSQTRPVSVESSHNRGLPIVVMVTRRRSPTPRPAVGAFRWLRVDAERESLRRGSTAWCDGSELGLV
eukprot:4678563-Pyramimonas_sp.AAC.1